jgi:hypothetical protein
MKIPNAFFLFILGIHLFNMTSCKPDCDSYTQINATVDYGFKANGSQVLIRSQNVDFLKTKTIFLAKSGATENTAVQSDYKEGLGIVVTLPDDLEPNNAYHFLVEDPDCGGMIPLSSINVVNDAFFTNQNPVWPSVPNIIIPINPPSIPPAVVDAWFSPHDQKYCIWIKPSKDGSTELPTLVTGVVPFDGTPCNQTSMELHCMDPLSIYHNNPVSGIIDRENNYIYISIDRSSKGLGIENYWGTFIHSADLDPTTSAYKACNDNLIDRSYFMLLTSETTGQQLVLFRRDPAQPDC